MLHKFERHLLRYLYPETFFLSWRENNTWVYVWTWSLHSELVFSTSLSVEITSKDVALMTSSSMSNGLSCTKSNKKGYIRYITPKRKIKQKSYTRKSIEAADMYLKMIDFDCKWFFTHLNKEHKYKVFGTIKFTDYELCHSNDLPSLLCEAVYDQRG